jgi:hypothetical protein
MEARRDEKEAGWKKREEKSDWNGRDVLANPVRAVTAVAGVEVTASSKEQQSNSFY